MAMPTVCDGNANSGVLLHANEDMTKIDADGRTDEAVMEIAAFQHGHNVTFGNLPGDVERKLTISFARYLRLPPTVSTCTC